MPTSDFSQFPIDPSRGPSAPHVERDRLTGEITNLPEKVREPAVFNSKAFKPTDAQVELMRGDLIKAGIDPAKRDEALRRDGFTIKPQIDPYRSRARAGECSLRARSFGVCSRSAVLRVPSEYFRGFQKPGWGQRSKF